MVGFAATAPSETRTVRSVVAVDSHTGKLVRRLIVSAPKEAPQAPDSLKKSIDAIAERNQVEAPLVHSVILAESNYNPVAVSDKGAQGLMQLMPATARRFDVKDSFDSEQNVEGGVKYLKYLIDLYQGDYTRAVAAYNAGEAAVAKYGGVPPYKETQEYVSRVARNLEAQRRAFTSTKGADSAKAAPAPAADPETGSPVIASVSPDGKVHYRTP